MVREHSLGRDTDRLQSRAAEAIDGCAGGSDGQTSFEGGQSCDVVTGGSLGQSTADDDVLDLAWLDRGAFDRMSDGMTCIFKIGLETPCDFSRFPVAAELRYSEPASA